MLLIGFILFMKKEKVNKGKRIIKIREKDMYYVDIFF